MPGTNPPTDATRFLAWRPLQRSTRLAILVALLATASYQMFLLDPSHRGNTWLWLAMIAAELITAAAALGTWWTILAHDDRSDSVDVTVWRNRLRASERPPTIDVFITAYGEPVGLVAATVRAARDMDLAHETFVLDDGDNDELQAVCADLGVHRLPAPPRRPARQGRQRQRSPGPHPAARCVVVFDADHVPDAGFLLEVLPHFVDPAVAFVQSPQFYDNRVNLVATGAERGAADVLRARLPGEEPLQRRVLRRHQRHVPAGRARRDRRHLDRQQLRGHLDLPRAAPPRLEVRSTCRRCWPRPGPQEIEPLPQAAAALGARRVRGAAARQAVPREAA